MEYRLLGRTNLRVSALGLGCGGPSKLGIASGASIRQAAELIRCAVDGGVNLIDTARAYGTEEAVGVALGTGLLREQLVLCSKRVINRKGERLPAADLRSAIDDSLRCMATDCIDIYLLHAVLPEDYRFACSEHLPVLLEAREAGKIRYFGVSERFSKDRSHQMLTAALQDEFWDVVMPGYSPLSCGVESGVLPLARRTNRGLIAMYSFRDASAWLAGEPLDLARQRWGADTTAADLAYAFCAASPAVHSVLTGTGTLRHLESNLAGFRRMAPLRQELIKLLAETRAQFHAEIGSESGSG